MSYFFDFIVRGVNAEIPDVGIDAFVSHFDKAYSPGSSAGQRCSGRRRGPGVQV